MIDVIVLWMGIFGCIIFLVTVAPWLVYVLVTAMESLLPEYEKRKVEEEEEVDGLEEILVGSGDKEAMRPTRRAIRRGIKSGGERMTPMKRVTKVKKKEVKR